MALLLLLAIPLLGCAVLAMFGARRLAPEINVLFSGATFLASIALSIGYGIGFAGLASAQGAFLANLFPTRYRFSGIAMTRELNSLLIAGPTPFIASALVAQAGGKPILVVAYLMLCCAISAIAIIAVRSRSFERGSE